MKNKQRGAWDVEAEAWVRARCIGILANGHYICETDKGHTVAPEEVLRRGLMRMFDITADGGPRQWWAHNGGKYDTTLMLPLIIELGAKCTGIIASGRLLSLTMTLDGVTIQLCDSYAVVSAALGKAAKSFGLKSAKLFTKDDYRTVHLWSEEKLIEGCYADCQIVIELLDAVEQMLAQYGGELKLTAASSALSVLRSQCTMIDISKDSDVNTWCRPAYYGGRVEVFKHLPDRELAYWDVNSSYPWSLSGRMPSKPLKMTMGRKASEEYGTRESIVVEATVSVPEMYVPPLPYRDPDGGLYFATGRMRGRWVGEELRFAESVGCRIERVHSAQSFDTARPYGDFVDSIYALKAKSTGALRETAKLLLNSSYGKLGERPERETLIIVDEVEGAELLYNAKHDNYRCLARDGDTRFLTRESFYWAKQTHYAQAATVTARSRILLAKHFMSSDYLCYGDTDSIHAASTNNFAEGSDFGSLKREVVSMRATYYAPKVYRLDMADKVTLHAKGFALGNDDEQTVRFETLVTGQHLKIERMRLVKQMLAGSRTPERTEDIKQWQGFSNKRAVTQSRDGDTRPWTVQELTACKHHHQLSPALKQQQ